MSNPFEYKPPEGKMNSLSLIEHTRQDVKGKLTGCSFETERGSVYTYDNQCRTARYKKATEEQCETQDITVFLDTNKEENILINDAIHTENPDLKRKTYVSELIDNESKIIRTFSEVTDPRNLYFGVYDKQGKIVLIKKASLIPKLGYTVFDTRHYKNGNTEETERHLGHKVIKID